MTNALERAHSSREGWWTVELYRLKGELLRQRVIGPRHQATMESEAEACFRQAIAVARCQGAKSLELRAVISLNRLWRQQGKKEHARQLLADVYSWFTEGFETKDLQEAKALLEEVGANSSAPPKKQHHRSRSN